MRLLSDSNLEAKCLQKYGKKLDQKYQAALPGSPESDIHAVQNDTHDTLPETKREFTPENIAGPQKEMNYLFNYWLSVAFAVSSGGVFFEKDGCVENITTLGSMELAYLDLHE